MNAIGGGRMLEHGESGLVERFHVELGRGVDDVGIVRELSLEAG